MSDGSDRRNVLHAERERPRRLSEHESRVRPEVTLDRGARQGIVVRNFDAETSQVVVAEAARGSVDSVGDESVVAGLEQREQRQRGRGESRGHGKRRVRALDGRDRVLQVGDRGKAVQAVTDAFVFAACRLLELFDGGKQHRRRAEDRRVDGAQELLRRAPQMAGAR